MAAITLSIGVSSCARFIAEYLNLIESASNNTKKLIHAPLQSALLCLQDAIRSIKNEQRFQMLIQEAEKNFRNAIPLEENESKVDALSGLVVCQLFLDDVLNADANFDNLMNVAISESVKKKATAISVLSLITPVGMLSRDCLIENRENILNNYKKRSAQFVMELVRYIKYIKQS